MGRHRRTAQSRDKVANARQQGERALSGGVARGAVLFLAGVGITTLVATLIGSSGKAQPKPIAPITAVAKQDTASGSDLSDRLGDLLTLADADLAAADIARLNLHAAEGCRVPRA